jgi:dTDP-glucose 4,6-dehydratase
LSIYGEGKNSREWIYVLDHCKALYKIYQKGKVGEQYNIGTNQNYKNLEIAKKIILLSKEKKIYNKKSKFSFVKDRPGHDLRYALDSSKIKKKIKWKHRVNISDGLIKTLNWYLDNKNFYKLVRNKNFITRIGKPR